VQNIIQIFGYFKKVKGEFLAAGHCFFEQRDFKHISAFVSMQMCAC